MWDWLIWLGEHFMRFNADQWDYVAQANTMQRGHCASYFRLPGTCVMIILSRLVFGEDHWIVGIALFHWSMLGITSVFLYRLMRDLAWPYWIRAAVVFVYSTGIYLCYAHFATSHCMFSSFALISISILCRMCLGSRISRVDRFACFASLFSTVLFRETAFWLALTLLPLLFVLYKRLHAKAFSTCLSCAFAIAIPLGMLLSLSWYSLGIPVISIGQGHALTYPIAAASQVHPEFVKETWLKEVFPDGGRLSWWEDGIRAYHIIEKKRAEDLALRDPSKAIKARSIARAQLGEEIKRDFFKLVLTHPIDWLKMFPVMTSLNALTYHGPLCGSGPVFLEMFGRERLGNLPESNIGKSFIGYSREELPVYKLGSSKFASFFAVFLRFYGIFLSILGAIYAIMGLPALFQKYTETKKEALIRSALLGSILCFSAIHGLMFLAGNLAYMLHATFLSGFLGWWAIADFVKKRKRCCCVQ